MLRLIFAIGILLVVSLLVGVIFGDFFNVPNYGRLALGVLAVILIIILLIIAAGFHYRKPKADLALVRTGGRGEKVQITGGMWINTFFHEVKEISLNTMRIEVVRDAQDALITLDLNRADTEAVFYIKVEPAQDDILKAAQSLGDKSMTPETIRELIDSKLEGALRSVAAETQIQDLLQRRVEFADKVQTACGEDLKLENGLKLETVSIIRVDQTPTQSLDPENRFDAVGLRDITEITADQAREKERIVQEKEVAIVRIDVDARIQKLEAEMDQAFAESDQQKNIAIYAAEREADTLKFQFEMEQGVQEREYEMKQEVEKARILQEQTVQEREIEMTREVEVARIEQEQTVAERDIQKNLIVETKQIETTQAVELAEIERVLTVALQRIEQEQTVEAREYEKELFVQKAKIATEEGVSLREIERTLLVETARFAQEQQVQQREIEKNLVVETASIEQNRQVALTEIQKVLAVETARLAQEQAIGERTYEKELFVEKAKITAEEGVSLRDIDRTLSVETSRFGQEQQVQQREIEKNLVLETAQINQNRQVELTEINRVLTVEQSRIDQELAITLRDEDRKIDVAHKQQVTALAEKEKLIAQAEQIGAEVGVTATQRVKEAEWQRDVAVIGAEAQAQPIERLADAVLSEAKAKAQGEMAHLEARNIAEQRVLVQEAILELIETSPELAEKLMKPVEKIDSIKILDMGGNDGGGADRNNMGRLANNLLDTGAISPMLKELFNFADVDVQQIADKVAEYLAGLVNRSGQP
jgi:uncharacterized membrane protein YqiK